jgi:hypothetical protein
MPSAVAVQGGVEFVVTPQFPSEDHLGNEKCATGAGFVLAPAPVRIGRIEKSPRTVRQRGVLAVAMLE